MFLTRADRGLELAVSTKTLAVSVSEAGEHGKNLANRWEEFDGDLKNLRGRFPLAVIGALLLVSKTLFVTDVFPAAADMLSKLTARGRPWVNAYDAATIIVAPTWAQGQNDPVQVLRLDDVRARHPDFPEYLAADHFFDGLIQKVLERAPNAEHRLARRNMLDARHARPADQEAPDGACCFPKSKAGRWFQRPGNAVGVGSQTEYPGASWEVAQWLTSTEFQKLHYKRSIGGVVARKSIYRSPFDRLRASGEESGTIVCTQRPLHPEQAWARPPCLRPVTRRAPSPCSSG
ncbi:MAG: hypothetical protein HY332_16805 [Chloroflexi bacterium]|nr:hypothetical protein [Chloroflexota bacterium]